MRGTGELSYYEELGVTKNASAEEIRSAFRALVRLLHPDQQADEQLKFAADLQMRKLNRIYGVLSDAKRRREYDNHLKELPATSRPVFRLNSDMDVRRLLERFAWVGAAVAVVGVLVWLAAESPGGTVQSFSPPAAQKTSGAPAPVDHSNEILQLRSDLNAARAERDVAVRELARLREIPPREPEKAAPRAEIKTAQPAVPVVAAEVPQPARHLPVPVLIPPVHPLPAVRTFAGFWFYTRPSRGQQNKNAALYPPEFIEATMTEKSGVIHGKYRSRYQIVDRAISPDVDFEFTGTPNGPNLGCQWSGPGDSRGELTLRMSSDNTVEVDWTAKELGSVQGLISGTAHLTRRVE